MDDMNEISPEEQLQELAAIFAQGYLRLKKKNPLFSESLPQKELDCPVNQRHQLEERLT